MKNKEWVCTQGCENIDKACEHLEKLMPKMHNRLNTISIEKIGSGIWVNNSGRVNRFSEPIFINRLEKLGLQKFEIDLILARFVDRKTFGDLIKEQNYTSQMQAFRTYKRILEKIKLALGKKPKNWWDKR